MTTTPGLDIEQLHADADRDGITKLVVGAVVHSDGHVLILRRSADDAFMAGIQELPSGGLEPGENLLTAIVTLSAPRRSHLRGTAWVILRGCV